MIDFTKLDQLTRIEVSETEAGILAETLREYADAQDQRGDGDVAAMNRERAEELDALAATNRHLRREAFGLRKGDAGGHDR
jgi:hypothetical protein